MAMDFPASPTVGQLYSPGGGAPTYRWSGALWVPQVGSGVFLEKGNNLSDVPNKQLAMGNLGLLWRPSERLTPSAVNQLVVAIPAGSRQFRIRGQFWTSLNGAEAFLAMRVPNNANNAYVATASYAYQRAYNGTNTTWTTDRITGGTSFQVTSVIDNIGWPLTFELDITIGDNGVLTYRGSSAGYRPGTDSFMQALYTGGYATNGIPLSVLLMSMNANFAGGTLITTEYAV